MIARDIEHPCAIGDELDDLLDDHHVGDREVPLGKLPPVNDVSIEDQYVRGDAFEIVDQFFSPAAIGSEVNI
jgi:hypothetical protein